MKSIISWFLLSVVSLTFAQPFTRRDSLQGGLRPERTGFDVLRYDLNVELDPYQKSLRGYNDITFTLKENTPEIQIDLFENMRVDSILLQNRTLKYRREYDAVFIELGNLPFSGFHTLRFYYSGHPKVAKNAPWDGGFVFTSDKNGKPWIGVAVQGTGASLWYPVKDTQTDEPQQGASINIAVPDGLTAVSNGRLIGTNVLPDGKVSWKWEVVNPINSYNITLNVADYALITDRHKNLDIAYYVLKGNEEKAKTHFAADVGPMLDCFTDRFGAYPFEQDGFKLVETPYLGMEHQSAIAYGNQYRKGYLGADMSDTGLALRFDYIVIHETAHEWFGNSITSADIADLWIHESFTTYAESVFIECLYGYEDALRYINGQKRLIANNMPMIGTFGVNFSGSSDVYYKGSNMLNTMRHVLANDSLWYRTLRRFAETYRHQIIETKDVLSFFNRETGYNFTRLFNQYLRTTQIPRLKLDRRRKSLRYKFENVVEGFALPVNVIIQGKTYRLEVSEQWQSLRANLSEAEIKVRTDQFLIQVQD